MPRPVDPKPVCAAQEPAERDFAAERKQCVETVKTLMKQEHSELALAECWLTLADIAAAEKDPTAPEIQGYLSSAQMQLDSPALPHDRVFAEACRRFAPVFAQYGRADYAATLRRLADGVR